MISCSHQLAPDDEELFAYVVDDEPLNDEQKQHLDQCPICQQRLKDYQHLHGRLSRLYRSDCPEPTQLMLYSEQILPIEDVYEVKNHLRTCRLCSQEVAEMRTAIETFDPFSDYPVHGGLSRLKEGVAQQWRHIVAQLIPPPTPIRVRGDFIQYYQAGEFSFFLQRSLTITGQKMILGIFIDNSGEHIKSIEGSQIDLYLRRDEARAAETTLPDYPAERPLMSTTVDAQGEFSFSPLAPGIYSLRVHLPDMEVEVEQVKIE